MDIKFKEHNGSENCQDSVVAVGQCYALNLHINQCDQVLEWQLKQINTGGLSKNFTKS